MKQRIAPRRAQAQEVEAEHVKERFARRMVSQTEATLKKTSFPGSRMRSRHSGGNWASALMKQRKTWVAAASCALKGVEDVLW